MFSWKMNSGAHNKYKRLYGWDLGRLGLPILHGTPPFCVTNNYWKSPPFQKWFTVWQKRCLLESINPKLPRGHRTSCTMYKWKEPPCINGRGQLYYLLPHLSVLHSQGNGGSEDLRSSFFRAMRSLGEKGDRKDPVVSCPFWSLSLGRSYMEVMSHEHQPII